MRLLTSNSYIKSIALNQALKEPFKVFKFHNTLSIKNENQGD